MEGMQSYNSQVDAKHCWSTKRPDATRKCALHACPEWETGDWSACSVSCGEGVQRRTVICSQERFKHLSHTACDAQLKPETERACFTGVRCEQADADRRQRGFCAWPF